MLILACSDPPDPEPAHAGPSTARWVEWRREDAAVSRPIVIFFDVPGGAVDRLAADADVTTFLNDRFHPVFRVPELGVSRATVQFLTADGCPFGPAFAPASAAEIIAAGNEVVLRPEARGRSAPRIGQPCPRGGEIR